MVKELSQLFDYIRADPLPFKRKMRGRNTTTSKQDAVDSCCSYSIWGASKNSLQVTVWVVKSHDGQQMSFLISIVPYPPTFLPASTHDATCPGVSPSNEILLFAFVLPIKNFCFWLLAFCFTSFTASLSLHYLYSAASTSTKVLAHALGSGIRVPNACLQPLLWTTSRTSSDNCCPVSLRTNLLPIFFMA